MTENIAQKIHAELKHVETDIAAQKKAVKRSAGNKVVIEAAKSELNALRTRRGVLEGNLQKLQQPG
jgi:hypothetical protein